MSSEEFVENDVDLRVVILTGWDRAGDIAGNTVWRGEGRIGDRWPWHIETIC